MNEEELKAGDIVRLNSGGPDMTIERIIESDEGPRACCNWFVGSKPQKEYFKVEHLQRANRR